MILTKGGLSTRKTVLCVVYIPFSDGAEYANTDNRYNQLIPGHKERQLEGKVFHQRFIQKDQRDGCDEVKGHHGGNLASVFKTWNQILKSDRNSTKR